MLARRGAGDAGLPGGGDERTEVGAAHALGPPTTSAYSLSLRPRSSFRARAMQMVVICSIALNVECSMIRDSVNNHFVPRAEVPYSSLALRGMHAGYSVASKRQMRAYLSQKPVALSISRVFA